MNTLTLGTETLYRIRNDQDAVGVRSLVRRWAAEVGMDIVDQTKLVTCASELTRNILVHGGGEGILKIDVVSERGKTGIRLTFQDSGPGIPDVEQAMKDGFTTGNGLGLGLGGARRLVDEFHIESEVGRGTTVTITKWAA